MLVDAREEAVVTRLHRVIVLLLFAAGASTPAAAPQGAPEEPLSRPDTRERNLRAYTELLRSDLRTQKVAVITELMQFTEAEDAAFWPIYRDYERDLSRLHDERLRAIETYATAYKNLTAATADELATKALDLEVRRAALKQKYYSKVKTALSPIRAAKALQIENQIQLLVDLQVAASLPIVQ
jgi:hypothetical protein